MTQNLMGKIVLLIIGGVLIAMHDTSQGRPVQNLGVGIMCTMLMVFILDSLTKDKRERNELR